MATISGSTSSQYWGYRVVATEIHSDIPNNQTKIKFQVQITRIGNASYIAGQGTISLTVGDKANGGTTTYSSGTLSYNINPVNVGVWHTLWEKEIMVAHADDGTKTCTVSSSWSNNVSPATGSASGSFNVTTIPRTASLALSAGASTLNSAVINVNASATVSKIEYKIDSGNYVTSSASSVTSYSLKVPGLSPGKTYSVTVRITRKDSGLTTTKSISVTTQPLATFSGTLKFTLGNTWKISFSNPGKGTLDLSIQVGSGAVITRKSVGNPYSFTPTASELDSMYAACPNTNHPQVKFTVTTLLNGTALGSKSQTGSADVVNSAPIFTGFTVTDSNSATLALTGNNKRFIAGQSTAHVTFPAAQGVNHARIVKYRISNGSKSVDTTTLTGEISKISSSTITVTAIDSRENSTKLSQTLSWLNYSAVTLTGASANRRNGIDAETILAVSGTGWYGNFGLSANAVNLKYRFKQTSASSYGSWISVVPVFSQAHKVSFNQAITGNLGVSGFDMEKSFDLEISLSDALTSATIKAVVDRGVSTMSLYQDHTEFNGDILLNGVSIQSVSPQNHLVNTDWLIAQRTGATSYTTQLTYTFDRWYNGTIETITREKNTSPSNARYMLKLTMKNGEHNSLCQPFEDFEALWDGKTVTVSAWMKADKPSSVRLRVGVSEVVCKLGTSWKLYKGTFTAKKSTQWNLNGFNFILLADDRPGVVWMAAPQVVYGSYVGTYQPRTYSGEMSECQRFYQVIDQLRVQMRGCVTTSPINNYHFPVPFPMMRQKPTFTFTPSAVIGTSDCGFWMVGPNGGYAYFYATAPNVAVVGTVRLDAEIYS